MDTFYSHIFNQTVPGEKQNGNWEVRLSKEDAGIWSEGIILLFLVMSFSCLSFLMNKPRKDLRRVDQSLLIQLRSSSSFECCWGGICKYHWYLMVTILLKRVVVPDFLLGLLFHSFSLWLLTGIFVSNSCSTAWGVFGRRQIPGCKLMDTSWYLLSRLG